MTEPIPVVLIDPPGKKHFLPLWVRRFLFDFVTTVIPSLVVFNFVQPSDALTPALVTAVAAAGVAAFTRNMDGMKEWLGNTLGVNDGA